MIHHDASRDTTFKVLSSEMSSKHLKVISILIIFTVWNKVAAVSASDSNEQYDHPCFKSIISFGDSVADTGNAAYLQFLNHDEQEQELPFYMLPPYGETYFRLPTGRCSDGRLLIDFIAEMLGIEFVRPYHGKPAENDAAGTSSQGGGGSVNLAVVGATALEDSFFRERGVEIPMLNTSLSAQFLWFKHFLSLHCHTFPECQKFLQSTLVLVGEIGGNDYNHAFLQGKTEPEVKLYVPQVIKAIGTTVNDLISLGAVTLIVPGNFPIGCSAVYLTYFYSNNTEDYSAGTNCIEWLNRFAQYHNKLLQKEINRIQALHPHTTIIYADYYNAAMGLYRSPDTFGFKEGALKACCGAGGLYNVDLDVKCGYPRSIGCAEPSLYVNWDGLHLTEAAHKLIARALFQEPNATTQLSSICTRTPNGGLYSI